MLRDESYLLVKLGSQGHRVIKEYWFQKLGEAASLIKIFYALEILRRIEKGLIKNKSLVNIKPDMVSKYGTNVLGDLFEGKDEIRLSLKTLIGLMIKFSCNSSTSILKDLYLPSWKELQNIAKEIWGLQDIVLVGTNGEHVNKISLRDMYKLYDWIYRERPMLLHTNEFLKEKLKSSVNIYYLFDQLEIKILGLKTGTLFKDGYYWINDSGVIEINNQKYFLGAMVKDKHISKAVIRIREIGKDFIELIHK